ncbi:4-(cytidine 5'-diphospho)-2-C-methyl-D-erythritol kinase [Lentisphaera marina]|uniref:4-(cytidine 5'-diphospho)-2-C-methyl-D-erythritol kinase n=1 Tax=Lentisphaera marina TaxID=1111041 RepID=UPI002365CED2|nr:4-(cytidine 5'-diphospho)-2-C-methyl-D-erythritol kinase [Lentisphaera marina]MDD7986826.1 4-(cytidine 5'-diphospho)-2-C-methyl-D-erythritol kinase [Lentisphaera marina]
MPSITVSCPGKVNLFLDVIGKRDDGYHLIESLFLPIKDIADSLKISEANAPGITISCNHPAVPLDSKNLIHKAAQAFAEKTLITPKWKIDLVKNIPVAGGMGGGSSNAASTFMALNELYDQPLNKTEMQELAIKIGADLPFFFEKSPAIVKGIGEKIASCRVEEKLFMLFVPFQFPVAAFWAYKNRQDGFSHSSITCEEYLSLLNNEKFPQTYNDLAKPLIEKFPLLKQACDKLLKLGAYSSNVSGSGPTCFALFKDQESLKQAHNKLKRQSIMATF